MVVGRGSFSESFPLFGYNFADYDALFAEKLDLLLQIRDQEIVTWEGKFRPDLHAQKIIPRPYQKNYLFGWVWEERPLPLFVLDS